jgi:hypothetical protein
MTEPRVWVARVIYVLGFVLASATAVNGLTDESPVEWVVGPAMGLAIWWIAAGIAIRIGVFPREFLMWVRSWIGLAERDRR